MNAEFGAGADGKSRAVASEPEKAFRNPEAKVLRNGTVTPIPARELVVGDVILLEALGLCSGRRTTDRERKSEDR